MSELQLNPKATNLINKFADWLQDEERRETDLVIFYYSGHGEYLQGERHYLLQEDTDPKRPGQNDLATEELVRPLQYEGVKISQILYIIDTCYAQSGAGNVTEFASKVIQQYLPIKGANIAVHTIAACRAKQTAEENVFSNALEEILKDWRANELKGGYIYPSELVDKINKRINSSSQRVVHNNAGSETSAKFFPFVPKTLQTWEEKRHKFIDQLSRTLNKKLNDSLFFINSFILSSEFIEEFVLDELSFREKLKELAIKPVSDEICPLIACSEWCRLRFGDRGDRERFNPTLAKEIENWQDEVIHYREGVNLNKIKEFVKQSFNEFKALIKKEDLRIQIEIEPEVDKEKNTGLATGSFLLNMNLWIESQDLPLGRFAENVVLKPQGSEEDALVEKSDSLRMCLEKEDFLSKLIHKARYSLPELVKLKIEIFLPFDFFQESLESICFQFGRRRKPLGKEYPIFINSFERYFDEDFREIRDAIQIKKKALWSNDNNLESELYYIGTEPSESDLEMIEEALPIAVWSRCRENPLTEGNNIKISEWKNWPHKIHHLRKQRQDLEVTLFWDDLYPKPSERSRPLNTKLVE